MLWRHIKGRLSQPNLSMPQNPIDRPVTGAASVRSAERSARPPQNCANEAKGCYRQERFEFDIIGSGMSDGNQRRLAAFRNFTQDGASAVYHPIHLCTSGARRGASQRARSRLRPVPGLASPRRRQARSDWQNIDGGVAIVSRARQNPAASDSCRRDLICCSSLGRLRVAGLCQAGNPEGRRYAVEGGSAGEAGWCRVTRRFPVARQNLAEWNAAH